MYSNQQRTRTFGLGAGGPPPRDLLILLGVLFVTYALHFFDGVAGLIQMLKLSTDVWQRGFLWQLATYPFVAQPAGGLWFLLSLFIIFLFGRDVYRAVGGSRPFWRLLAWAFGSAALVAVVAGFLLSMVGLAGYDPFVLMRGQYMVLTVLIAAFATAYGNATIFLMFVLPIRARWFLWLEILFAFMGYLTTKDFAGFLGICTAVGMTWALLSGQGPRGALREARLRIERLILEQRLRRMRKKSGLRVVKPGEPRGPRDPWVH